MSLSVLNSYRSNLSRCLDALPESDITNLVNLLWQVRQQERQVFICGNGGSAANALHISNDLLYGINPSGAAMRVEALSANTAVMTCLGNDTGYVNIFSHQLKVKGVCGDLLLVLSGSGNSPNILAALEQARVLGMHTFAVVGYDGGKAKIMADANIHIDIPDMQISEDMQLILGHIVMRELHEKIQGEHGK
jgi:D-sedoheptulose 7-phosphate isomerase